MNEDEFLCQVQHRTVRRKLEGLDSPRPKMLLSFLRGMTRCTVVDEDTVAHSSRTEVVFDLLQMANEDVTVDGALNNIESNHLFKGMCHDARVALPVLVGGDICILSFLSPPIATDALIGEAILITEEELLVFVDKLQDLLSTFQASRLVVGSESPSRTVVQDLARVAEIVFEKVSHGTHAESLHQELSLDHCS